MSITENLLAVLAATCLVSLLEGELGHQYIGYGAAAFLVTFGCLAWLGNQFTREFLRTVFLKMIAYAVVMVAWEQIKA